MLVRIHRQHVGHRPPTTYAPYADTRYLYTARDELEEVYTSQASNTDSNPKLRHTKMEYDKLGRKTKLDDKDVGVWTYGYDDAGNMSWQKDSAGQVICFYYDNLNRIARRAANGTETDCPDAGPASGVNHLASYRYGDYVPGFNNGRLTEVSWGPNPAGNKDTFTYDAQGRLQKQTRLVGGVAFSHGIVAFDVLDRPEQVKRTAQTTAGTTAVTVEIGYDKEGENSLTAGGTLPIDKVTHNKRGQLALLSRAPGAPDMSLTYYNSGANFGRLNTIRNGSNADIYPDFSYTAYDSAGNLKGMAATQANAGTYSFGYDDLNRLTTAGLTGAGAANLATPTATTNWATS